MNGLPQLKKLVAGCFAVDPKRYWLDLLGTALVAWTSFAATEWWWDRAPALAALAFAVCVFATYRGLLFVHEVTHRDGADLPGFTHAWALFFGTPYLLPPFMYRSVHLGHHKKTVYGTDTDGEYLPFGAWPVSRSVLFVLASVGLPALQIFRFLVIAPLSLVDARLRRFVMVYGSALTLRFDVPRKLPTGPELRNWHIQELLCALYVWALAACFATGALNVRLFLHAYALVAVMFVVNATRTMVAHRFCNQSLRALTIDEQLLDSVNLEGSPILGELLCPLGLRYHGLHHLFPKMPYHQLATAHRRLREQLPRDAPYHATVEPTLGSAFATLWRNSARAVAPGRDGPPRERAQS